MEADSAVDTDQAARGASLLEHRLAAYETRFTRNRCLYVVRLAKAQTHCGAVDGAAESVEAALNLMDRDVASARIATELRKVVKDLARIDRCPQWRRFWTYIGPHATI